MIYDPFDPATVANPYPAYEWLRAESPVHHVESADIWVISRYDDLVAALRNHHVFSSNQGNSFERRPVPMLVGLDQPEHTRLRRRVAKDFTPRAIAALAPRVHALVDEMLDRALADRAVDLVAALAEPLPVVVIAELMGVPAERQADFRRWSDATIDTTGGVISAENEAAIAEFAQYFLDLIAERRSVAAGESGSDDIISVLLRPDRDGDHLSDQEIVAFCILLLVAGNETTTNLIANGAITLMAHPDEWRKVVEEPALVPSLVEESLRYESPVQGLYRNTLADVEVAGTTIPADAKVLMLYGSANRDTAKWPDAAAFRAERNPFDHLGFASGIHVCLGAPLARLEASAVAEAFLRRRLTLRADGEVERGANPSMRSVKRVPVVLEAS